jgi:hypothetical protein
MGVLGERDREEKDSTEWANNSLSIMLPCLIKSAFRTVPWVGERF